MDADPILPRRRRCRRNRLPAVRRQSATGPPDRAPGQTHPRLPTRAAGQLRLPPVDHRPRRRHRRVGSRPPPPCRDRRRHPRPQIRCRTEPPPIRPFRRQHGLARSQRDRPQPRPLDQPPRPPRNRHRHRHPPPTPPSPPRTDHPLRPALHPPPPNPMAGINPHPQPQQTRHHHRPRPIGGFGLNERAGRRLRSGSIRRSPCTHATPRDNRRCSARGRGVWPSASMHQARMQRHPPQRGTIAAR